MTPDSIVKHLDIIKHIAAGFVSCRVNPALDPLPFEQLKEALGDRVVVTVTPSAHAATQVVHIPADHEHQFRFNVNTISGPM